VETAGPDEPCGRPMRNTQYVALRSNISSGQAYGVYMPDSSYGTNTLTELTIASSNDLASNSVASVFVRPTVYLDRYSGVQYTLDQSIVPDTPRALVVDAVSPGTSRCDEQGTRRETFAFQATDAFNAANIDTLEGIFSVSGDDATGTGGPGPASLPPVLPAQYCHFIYYLWTDTLYLSGPDYDRRYEWADSSTLGSSGHDLVSSATNSYCTIHASSSSSELIGKTLRLNLDIEFTGMNAQYHKHVYAVVTNLDGQQSFGGQWRYWGWWSAK